MKPPPDDLHWDKEPPTQARLKSNRTGKVPSRIGEGLLVGMMALFFTGSMVWFMRKGATHPAHLDIPPVPSIDIHTTEFHSLKKLILADSTRIITLESKQDWNRKFPIQY